jgi:hypothetical protein
MNEQQRWAYLAQLDEDLLKGGAILSEWCSIIVRESDVAFAKGASLASLLTAVAAIETYLRSEAGNDKNRLVDLIDAVGLEDDLRGDLHQLRAYRNKWVHVKKPWEDGDALAQTEQIERELEEMAMIAAKALRRTIFQHQWA